MTKRTNGRRALAALAATALLAQGCITSSQVAMMGDKEAAKVEQSMGLMREAKSVDYVVAIGEKLAAQSQLSDGPWTFQVVDTPEPNAFALPGGHVFVSRGLLALVNSEDELAGVIGHEIGHVTARHSEKRIRATLATAPVAIATGIGGAAASIVSPKIGNIVAGSGQLFMAGVIAPFSRSQENDADEIGQQLAAKTGYDPSGISTFLHTLDREVKLLLGKEREHSFLDTHPMTPERVSKTEVNARTLVRAAGHPIARDHADFLSRLEGIVVGEDPAQGIFEEQVFLHPELDLAITFPKDWKTLNTASAVGAVSPSEHAVVSLRVAESDAKLTTVIKQLQAEQKGLAFERFEIRGLPSANTLLTEKNQIMDITLIEYNGDVYAVTGQAGGDGAAQYIKSFDVTARSFRALRSSERKSLKESRLRVRTARSGEKPDGIVERTGSTSSPEALAVSNGIEVDTVLREGQLLKVAIPQVYTPRKR